MTLKRILIFSTAYYPFVGGAEVAIKGITDRLSESFEFDLITAQFDKNLPKIETIGNVTIYRIGRGKSVFDKLLLPFRGAFLASRLVLKLEKDKKYVCMWGMMVTFGSGAGYIYNIVRSIGGRARIPMVLTLQEGDSDAHLRYRWGGLISLSWKFALRNTDFLTAISNFLLHRAERFGYSGKSALIPNGVDVKVFLKKILEKEKTNMKIMLQKKPGDIFLVTTSRLAHKNAVDDIISALCYLPENISLIVIGKGDEGSILQAQVDTLELSKRVKFLGFLPQNDLPQYLSVCDIFVRPSRSEGFGNSFIEAMAAGLPIIATPVGGIVDFIDDKETGIFCAPDNPKSIADAVHALLDNETLSQKIITQGRDRVLARYNWDTIAKEMNEKVFSTF